MSCCAYPCLEVGYCKSESNLPITLFPWALTAHLSCFAGDLMIQGGIQIRFQCRFCYFSGTVWATDKETITIEKIVCYSSQVEGHTTQCRAAWRSTRQSQGRGRGRSIRVSWSMWFPLCSSWEGQDSVFTKHPRDGRWVYLRLLATEDTAMLHLFLSRKRGLKLANKMWVLLHSWLCALQVEDLTRGSVLW